MMNKMIRNNIVRTAGALLFCLSFQACQEDMFDKTDLTSLLKQGRYLTARNTELVNVSKATYFEANTPYRLVAFSKKYKKNNATDATPGTHFRFNQVAWEGVLSDGNLHFLNVEKDPSKWFGFSALDGEEKGDDGLVSLDFYGFTYGEPMASHDAGYIPLDNQSATTLTDMKRTEEVSTTSGELNDLMHGILLNQNEQTAGLNATDGLAQSIIPFKHCFSKLIFKTVQQTSDTDPSKPEYENISVESVKLTNTYKKGTVNLSDGKVKLNDNDKGNRDLNMKSTPVTIKKTDLDSMIVFPSDESGLVDHGNYEVGLEIKVKGTDEKLLNQFLTNTGTGGNATAENGSYTATIKINQITNSTSIDHNPLYFKQNTAYTIVISFQDKNVRIITVIPMVEEWIPGEGTADNPYQDQALGQPQVFDNTVWSDRNLGADDYDAENQFEKAIGYFYQSGRNIPYWPFKKTLYTNSYPTPDLKRTNTLSGGGSENKSDKYVFPMVDPKILTMPQSGNWIETDASKIILDIPEQKPNVENFAFAGKADILKNHHKNWDKGPSEQPVPDGWEIPSAEQLMSIFPSIPYAGNITFRTGGGDYNQNPSQWGLGYWYENQYYVNSDIKTLRICVPYYNPNMDKPYLDKYQTAWNHWKNKVKDKVGVTNESVYKTTYPGSITYQETLKKGLEPEGDPSPGYCSVYLISREGSDETTLPTEISEENYRNRKWGVIYGIKKVGTNEAYRMRWRVICQQDKYDKTKANFYIEICRYRCKETDNLTAENKDSYDWQHPVARLYIPISGLVEGRADNFGSFYNYGSEVIYASSTSDTSDTRGRCWVLRVKISGAATANQYISVVRGEFSEHGKQLRLVRTK